MWSIYTKYTFVVCCSLVVNLSIIAQDPLSNLESLVTINQNNVALVEILDEITHQTGLLFSYSPEIINDQQISTCTVAQKPVRYALNQLFGNKIKEKERGKYILLVKNKLSNDKIYIKGYISESTTGERLSKVTVYNKELKTATVTNKYGYFRIELKPIERITQLSVCKWGFTDTVFTSILKSSFVDISLKSSGIQNNTNCDRKQAPSFLSWMIPKQAFINASNICNDSILSKIQVSFLPFIGTNSFLKGKMVKDYSFNILAGYCESVNKLEIGGCLNFDRCDVGYCQLAGIGNIVGGSTRGLQGAGLFNISKGNKGIQLAGITNVSKDQNKIQIAGVLNVADSVEIAQLSGIVNIADTVNGLQISGVINKAKEVKGAQIALINISDSCSGLPIGLFSYVKKGYHCFGFSSDEFIYLNAAYRTGVRHFYSILKAGVSPGNTNLLSLGFGFGSLLGKNEKRNMNIEMLQLMVNQADNFRFHDKVEQIYFGINRRLTNRIYFDYGMSLNYYNTEETDSHRIEHTVSHIPYSFLSTSTTKKIWLGARLGFRY